MTPEDLLKTKSMKFSYSGGDLVISCLNPEHEDSNPSMRVDRLNGHFNCFSCGMKGNIFRYFDITPNLVHQRSLEIKKKIAKLREKPLNMPISLVEYNKSFRGISEKTFKEFEAFTIDRVESADFAGRVIFPLRDHNDDIVSFIGRNMFSEVPPKYMVYPSGKSLPVFPPFAKPINGAMILVEGMFDLLNLYDKGLTNVITGFGITNITAKRLSPYKLGGVSKIYVFFDGDKPGRNAAKKVFEDLKDTFIVDYTSLVLEEGKDPGDLSKDEVSQIIDYLKN